MHDPALQGPRHAAGPRPLAVATALRRGADRADRGPRYLALGSGFVEPTAAAAPEAAITGRETPVVAPPPLNIAYPIDGRDEPVTGWESMRLKGLSFHGQYWSSRVASEESVFDQVIEHLGPARGLGQATAAR